MSKKWKSQNASQKHWFSKAFSCFFLGFSLKMTKFAYEFPRFFRGDSRLPFFAHSTRNTCFFEIPKRGQSRREQLSILRRFSCIFTKILVILVNCLTFARPHFGHVKYQVFHWLWAKNRSRKTPLRNHANSKANSCFSSDFHWKWPNSPMNSQGFWEAIRDFHFLLIAQGKLDILRVQNEVNCAGNSCPFWGDFLHFHKNPCDFGQLSTAESTWFWSSKYQVFLVLWAKNGGRKTPLRIVDFQRLFHAFLGFSL